MVQLEKNESTVSDAIDPVLDSFDPYRIPLRTEFPPDPYQTASSYGQASSSYTNPTYSGSSPYPRPFPDSSYATYTPYPDTYPQEYPLPQDPYTAPLPPTVNLTKPPATMTGVYPSPDVGQQSYFQVNPTSSFETQNRPVYPPYYQNPHQIPGKSTATASLVVSLIALFTMGLPGIMLSIVGIVLSVKSKNESAAAGWLPIKEANTGMIISIIVLILSSLVSLVTSIPFFFM